MDDTLPGTLPGTVEHTKKCRVCCCLAYGIPLFLSGTFSLPLEFIVGRHERFMNVTHSHRDAGFPPLPIFN